MLDRDSNLLFLAHTGERTVQFVQVIEAGASASAAPSSPTAASASSSSAAAASASEEAGSLAILGSYQSGELIGAIVGRSKHACDVRSVTLFQTLALTKRDVVAPIAFRLQRKRVEFFQVCVCARGAFFSLHELKYQPLDSQCQ
jgi:hypothetical protein